MKSTSNKS